MIAAVMDVKDSFAKDACMDSKASLAPNAMNTTIFEFVRKSYYDAATD